MFFMNRFKQSFSRFMYGRYGMDQLSRCLSYVVLVLIILTFFLRSNVIYTVALLGIVYIYFRMFSRNISKAKQYLIEIFDKNHKKSYSFSCYYYGTIKFKYTTIAR